MRQLLTRLALFASILVVIDTAFSRALDTARPDDYRAFIESKKGYDEHAERTELLFLGDSHTADAIVPRVVSRVTGLRVYNFGVYHMSPVEGFFLARDLVARSPKLRAVVLGTNPIMFTRQLTAGKYTPMFIESPLIFGELLSAVHSNDFSLFSRAAKKLDLVPPLVMGTLGYPSGAEPQRLVDSVDRGYLVNRRCPGGEPEEEASPPRYDQGRVLRQVRFFRDTLKFLVDRGLTVVVVHPPVHAAQYAKIKNLRAVRQLEDTVTRLENAGTPVLGSGNEYGVDFEDRDFLNSEHLCNPGALKFSAWVGAKLRRTLAR